MRTIFKSIIAVLSAVIFALTGVGESVVGFTDGNAIKATRRDYCFDNSGLLLGGYYATKDELQYCNDAGIQFIIASGVDEAYLDTAYKYGVGVIATGYNYPYCYADMTDSATDVYVNKAVSLYRDHPALWGDNVIDEPGAESYANIAKSINAYYAKHPDHIPYINLFPMYASDEQLEEYMTLNSLCDILTPFSDQFKNDTARFKAYTSDYINTLDTDYICVDIYPYHAKLNSAGKTVKYTGENWLRNLDILAEACRETDRDLWVITQAAGLTENGTENGEMRWCDEVSDISQQTFASLAFGSKAIIQGLFGKDGWWDADSHMIGSDGKPTDTYYAVSKVNGYLADFAEEYGNYKYTSTYILNSSKVAGYRHGRLACEVLSEEGNIKSSDGLLVGTFTGKGNSKAYIVTNMEELNNDSTVEFKFTVEDGKTATLYYKGMVIEKSESFKMNLHAGEGAYITVK